MKATTLQFYKQSLLRVLVHIQERLDEPLPLEELAARAGLSPYHFHRVFSGMLGESLHSHIRRLRLERAALRLKLTRRAVVDIALEAGFETHAAFTRAFRSTFGQSPTQFRAARGTTPQVRAACGVHYRENQPLRDFRSHSNSLRAMNITIQTIAPLRVAFMRHTGPYHECGAVWDRFCTLLGKEGLLGPGAQFIGVSHDDPEVTPADKLRYDACVSVDDAFAPFGEVGVQVIPGGEYAVMTHQGPYERLNEAYAKLMGQWLPRSGRALGNSPCFEVYLNSPESTEPADRLTDIHVPLAPRHTLA